MHRLVAVGSRQPFVYRINYQIHRLKGQRAEQHVLSLGNDQRRKHGAAIFPANFYPFGYVFIAGLFVIYLRVLVLSYYILYNFHRKPLISQDVRQGITRGSD
jgi:hypothetical protein